MYEYICSNNECNAVWTIREGDIGTLYLTCPSCKKSIGKYLRQVKDESEFKKIMKKNDTENSDVSKLDTTNQIKDKPLVVNQSKQQDKNADATVAKHEPKKPVNTQEHTNTNKQANTDVNNEDKEENIFDRIIKKRQQEQEFVKDIEEDIDILEIFGGSIAEVDKKIKEFEEHYYIKVVDKNIVQSGDRYNCIIKYQRK